MYQPAPIKVLAVVRAEIAERHATAERERLVRQVRAERPAKIIAFPTRPSLGNVVRLFDRTPPAPEAA